MTAWMIVALCGCGMATSLLSALFGVGGSILLVPVLHLLFPQCAVQVLAATSLTVVMLSALINVCAFWRQGIRLNTRLLVLWSLGMATGMQAGVYASFLLSDKVLLMLFALVLVGLALRCGFSHQTTSENVQLDNRTRSAGMLLCTAGGAVAGLTGLGGGAADVPALRDPTSAHRGVLQLDDAVRQCRNGRQLSVSHGTGYWCIATGDAVWLRQYGYCGRDFSLHTGVPADQHEVAHSAT